ncbi:MAG: TIGR04211 family SH3 domain-containing protein [Colwellia sp.]
MKNYIKAFVYITIVISTAMFAHAEESSIEPIQGFISDELFIYMHAGPGTNYRILGTINAGAEIKITGKSSDDYSEILDDKNRITWIESKYIATKPGLRSVINELKSKVTNASDFTSQLDGEVNELKSTIDSLRSKNNSLTTQMRKLDETLINTKSQLKGQDNDIKKQYFLYGAIVLAFGLFFGLLLPRLFTRRSASMESWK